MFRKVVHGFINSVMKPCYLGPFQKNLLQQKLDLPDAHESNDRNFAELVYKNKITKVQQLEIFSIQKIEVSEFLFNKILASRRSSRVARPFLEMDVQFEKFKNIARLNLSLYHHSKNQIVSFDANQQAIKNILAEREKSDTLNEVWGLIQNSINHSFREGKMHANKKHIENSQEEQFHYKDKLKSQIKEPNSQINEITEGQNLLDKNLNSGNQALNEEDKKFKIEDKKLKGKIQQSKEFKSKNEELNTKLYESKKKNKELNEELSNKINEVNILIKEREQLKNCLSITKKSLGKKDKELYNKSKELESKTHELEALKSKNESQVKDLQKQLESKEKELEDKDTKPSAINAQVIKNKVSYASASFILSVLCVVGTILTTPYLAICAMLAVAASVFLALGCYYSYKTNTELSNVEIYDRNVEIYDQQLLEDQSLEFYF